MGWMKNKQASYPSYIYQSCSRHSLSSNNNIAPLAPHSNVLRIRLYTYRHRFRIQINIKVVPDDILCVSIDDISAIDRGALTL